MLQVVLGKKVDCKAEVESTSVDFNSLNYSKENINILKIVLKSTNAVYC